MTRRLFKAGLTAMTLAIAVGSFAPLDAEATTFAPMSVGQFTDASAAIVQGEVLRVWTEMDAKGRVWTRAEVRVTETLKGSSLPETIVVDALGGTHGDYTLHVEGRASYSPGEAVFLFLEKLADDRWSSIGLYQGKFTIRRAPGDTRHYARVWTVKPGQRFDHRFLPHPAVGERLYLDELKAVVQERLAKGWDGQPVPGVSLERLRANNSLDHRIPR